MYRTDSTRLPLYSTYICAYSCGCYRVSLFKRFSTKTVGTCKNSSCDLQNNSNTLQKTFQQHDIGKIKFKYNNLARYIGLVMHSNRVVVKCKVSSPYVDCRLHTTTRIESCLVELNIPAYRETEFRANLESR